MAQYDKLINKARLQDFLNNLKSLFASKKLFGDGTSSDVIADCNAATATGHYIVRGGVTLNLPTEAETSYGALDVSRSTSANYLIQTLWLNTRQRRYTRYKIDAATWSSWRRVPQWSDMGTPSAVKQIPTSGDTVYTLANSTFGFLMTSGVQTADCGIFSIYCNGSGGVTVVGMASASNLTITPGTNSITITKTGTYSCRSGLYLLEGSAS